MTELTIETCTQLWTAFSSDTVFLIISVTFSISVIDFFRFIYASKLQLKKKK